MEKIDPFENEYVNRLQLFFYLVPAIGVLPALWTLYWRQGNREQQAVSRLSVTLAFAWLSGSCLLTAGAQFSEVLTLRLLIINSFLTSGYFLVSLWLMARLWQRKSVRLPGGSAVAEGVVRKYLS